MSNWRVVSGWSGIGFVALKVLAAGIFTSVKVMNREGNTVHLTADGKLLGRRVSWTEKRMLTPPEEDRSEAESGPSSISGVWKFDAVAEGTRVSWTAEIELKGILAKLFGPLARPRIQALVREHLEGFAKYIEAKESSMLGEARRSVG